MRFDRRRVIGALLLAAAPLFALWALAERHAPLSPAPRHPGTPQNVYYGVNYALVLLALGIAVGWWGWCMWHPITPRAIRRQGSLPGTSRLESVRRVVPTGRQIAGLFLLATGAYALDWAILHRAESLSPMQSKLGEPIYIGYSRPVVSFSTGLMLLWCGWYLCSGRRSRD